MRPFQKILKVTRSIKSRCKFIYPHKQSIYQPPIFFGAICKHQGNQSSGIGNQSPWAYKYYKLDPLVATRHLDYFLQNSWPPSKIVVDNSKSTCMKEKYLHHQVQANREHNNFIFFSRNCKKEGRKTNNLIEDTKK